MLANIMVFIVINKSSVDIGCTFSVDGRNGHFYMQLLQLVNNLWDAHKLWAKSLGQCE
jgi:ABC-type uncharacterized transport system permease subunit